MSRRDAFPCRRRQIWLLYMSSQRIGYGGHLFHTNSSSEIDSMTSGSTGNQQPSSILGLPFGRDPSLPLLLSIPLFEQLLTSPLQRSIDKLCFCDE